MLNMRLKKIFIFVCLVVYSLFNPVLAETVPESGDAVLSCIEKIKLQKNDIYSHINLTQIQKTQIENLDIKLYNDIEPILREMYAITDNIQSIANSNDCSMQKINEEKQKLKSVNKKLVLIKKPYEGNLANILTIEQRRAYKHLKKQKQAEMKREIKKMKQDCKN